MGKKLFTINGVQYMTPSLAGDKWDMSYQAVTNACKEHRIAGACKDSGDRWIIPFDAEKPLKYEEIRKLLVSILVLKNKPNDNNKTVSSEWEKVYKYLASIGLVEVLEQTIPDRIEDIVLTDVAMRIATEGQRVSINWVDASTTFVQVVASVITIWQTIVT